MSSKNQSMKNIDKINHEKSEEEEKSHTTWKEIILPVSIFFVDLQGLVDFLIVDGFFIDYISLRFRDSIGQGIKTYYSVNPQVIFKLIYSNKVFDIEEISFSKFFDKAQVKVRLDSIILRNCSISIIDNIKKLIR